MGKIRSIKSREEIDSQRKKTFQPSTTNFVHRRTLEITATLQFLQEKILDGKIAEKLEISEVTREVLRQLITKTAEVSSEFTEKEVIPESKHWRKRTSTSPSRRHLGHHKVVLKRGGSTEEMMQESIKHEVEKQTELVNFSFKHAFSYPRWQTVNTMFLQKEPGKPYLHRMRTINLHESDFNLGIKILWARKMMCNTEDERLFAQGQCGVKQGGVQSRQ